MPSLGLNRNIRDRTKINFPKTYGSKGRAKTLKKNALNWEGVRIYNSLPMKIRTWTGSKEYFKNMVDEFLSKIPDQSETSYDKPGGRPLLGESSNSIPDWVRVLEIDETDETDKVGDDPDDVECHDDMDNDPLFTSGEASHVKVLSSLLGSRLSPDHGCM